LKYVNGTKLDERIIRTDLDPGFKEGRQFGRGKSGGQVIVNSYYKTTLLNSIFIVRFVTNSDRNMIPVEVVGDT
jgi:hypothetical protein